MTCEESTVISVGIRSEFVFQKLPRARACYSNRNARDRCASSLLSMSEQFGLWLSLVERCVRDAEAVGSNPTSPTAFAPSWPRNESSHPHDHRADWFWRCLLSRRHSDALAPLYFNSSGPGL